MNIQSYYGMGTVKRNWNIFLNWQVLDENFPSVLSTGHIIHCNILLVSFYTYTHTHTQELKINFMSSQSVQDNFCACN